MLKGEQYLLIPGPTPVPDSVLRAMHRAMVNHRDAAFKEMFAETIAGVKKVYRTEGHLLMYASSGTGGLDSIVNNFLDPGDKVLAVSIGVFGDRFAKVAAAFGAQVEKMDFSLGQAADPAAIGTRLAEDKNHEIKAVLVTHNETSTGAYNDLKAIKAAMGAHPALLCVDAVSSLAGIEMDMDSWGIDVAISGSQKAFMLPPGMAFMAFNEKALAVHNNKKTATSLYWDVTIGLNSMAKNETPYTPPLSLVFGLQEALRLLLDEGLDNIYKRHLLYREIVRKAVQAMGLKTLAGDACASPVVTSVVAPEGVGGDAIRAYLLQQFNVVFSGGQGALKDKVFRIGHLGYVRELDLLAALGALEIALHKLGAAVTPGAGMVAAQQVLAAAVPTV